jgi:hypothetical protein
MRLATCAEHGRGREWELLLTPNAYMPSFAFSSSCSYTHLGRAVRLSRAHHEFGIYRIRYRD